MCSVRLSTYSLDFMNSIDEKQKYDYIIVGLGIAGMCFAEQLRKQKKSFVVITDDSQQSSQVAGGLYNPVILKRFTLAWNATAQLKICAPFYEALEAYLGVNIHQKLTVQRRFTNVEEQNLWSLAQDKPGLDTYLNPNLKNSANTHLNIPCKLGEVRHTGRIDTKLALTMYTKKLQDSKQLIPDTFDHSELIISDRLHYKNLLAKHIVFCEGFGLVNNPFFNTLPLVGNKGEYLIIKCRELKLEEALKTAIFILPLGEDLYKIGATYDTKNIAAVSTSEAKEKLVANLEQVLVAPYTIVDQVVGIRPTVKDRKPLIGTHPNHKNVHVLNGLGSRGVMIAPAVSKELLASIEYQTPLDPAIDIRRYLKN